jgi:hypothetical protein
MERNPEAMQLEPLPGYVWLDARPRRLHVWADTWSSGTTRRDGGRSTRCTRRERKGLTDAE